MMFEISKNEDILSLPKELTRDIVRVLKPDIQYVTGPLAMIEEDY